MTEQISLCLNKARPSYAGLGVKALNMRDENNAKNHMRGYTRDYMSYSD
ncbi:hypothetical protein [Psychrosphaera haliotis]|uniref:Uncharacterized protein n=1 Tax=Psychrosphaera haliotis TaxID=555083 RepID=A0A6N8F9P2_9GAMM|nr:hypothetical protein [Psychrosphaera haliotis]MUH73226.1 hypothetical protein [Psychrosphaera haliotis]